MRVLASILLASTILVPIASIASQSSTTTLVDTLPEEDPVRDALRAAFRHGVPSLLATVAENARLSPERWEEIVVEATMLAPAHSDAVRAAADTGVALGEQLAKRPPSPDELSRSYGNTMIGVEAARQKGLDGTGRTVAVIDSGIDRRADGYVHPEFEGKIDERSTSFLRSPSDDPSGSEDTNGHGTHVAGTIAAAANGLGVEGVASGSRILSIKAIATKDDEIHRDGMDRDTIVDSFRYLSRFGDVVAANGSFAYPMEEDATSYRLQSDEPAIRDAVRSTLDRGTIVVMAAGNEFGHAPIASENTSGIGLHPFVNPRNAGKTNSSGQTVYQAPAGTDFRNVSATGLAADETTDGISRGRIVVVVAVNEAKDITPYSNRCGVSRDWCIAAPGGDQPFGNGIVSTVPAEHGFIGEASGTSMAAPHVSGAIAVLAQAYPHLEPSRLLQILFETAEDLGEEGVDDVYGWGLLRLDLALQGIRPLDPDSGSIHSTYSPTGTTEWDQALDSKGGLYKAGGGELLLSSSASFQRDVTVSEGQLSVTSSLSTPALHVDTMGTIAGTGRILGQTSVAGDVSPGQSIGTLTFEGDLNLLDTARTIIEFDRQGNDAISVTGAGSDLHLGGILVARNVDQTGFTPAIGQLRRFVTVTDGELTGSLSGLDQADANLAAGSRLDVVYGTNGLDLVATPTSYANLPASGVATTDNATSFGAVVDQLRSIAGVRPTSDRKALYDHLYGLSPERIAPALGSAAGEIHLNAGVQSARTLGRFADHVSARQLQTSIDWHSFDRPVDGDPILQRRTWGSVDGSFLSAGGLDASTTSITTGFEDDLDGISWGIALGYARTTTDGYWASSTSDNFLGGVHAAINAEPFDIGLAAGGLYGMVDADRTFGPTSQTSEADQKGLFADVTISHTAGYAGTMLTPYVSAGYRQVVRDTLREEGALPLSAPKTEFQDHRADFGVRVSHPLVVGGTKIVPTIGVAYRNSLGSYDATAVHTFLGQGFGVTARDLGDHALLGEASISATNGPVSFDLGYDGEVLENGGRHSMRGTLRYRW